MATIPLPALDIRQQPQPDPLGSFQKLMALRSLAQSQQLQQQQIQSGQQEQQLRQQQIQDQQATTAAMKNWDPSSGDYDGLAKSVLQNGGSANAATAIQQHGLTIKKTISDIAAQDAASGSKNLETFIGKHKAVGDALEGIEQVPDEQLHATAAQKVQELARSGILDPQTAQQAMQTIQSTPDPQQLRQKIDVLAKASLGAKAVADQAKTQAETQESQATTQQKRMESDWYQAHGGAPGVPIEAQQQADWLSKNPGKTASDYVLWKAQHSPTMLMQGSFGQANDPMIDMVGRNQIDLATALQRVAPGAKDNFLRQLSAAYPNYSQGNFGIEKKVGEEFTSGDAAKNLAAFNTAIEHAQQLGNATDALDNGDMRGLNKIGNALGYQFGSDKTTNFNVIKSALSGEISKVFKGGQATDAEIREVQGPFDSANSPAQLKGAIENAVRLMYSKRDALNQLYESGVKAKPNFGGGGTSAPTNTYHGHTYSQQPDGSWKLTQ
jgi:hypothetical protein